MAEREVVLRAEGGAAAASAAASSPLGVEVGGAPCGGLLITSVDAGGVMQRLGVLEGDVLLSVAGAAVRGNAAAVRPAVEAAAREGRELTATVRRDVSREAERRAAASAPAPASGGVQIAARLGNPLCEACAACGREVVEDEGVARYHCVDCEMTDFCVPCFEGGAARGRHDPTHTVVRETAGPVSLRLMVLGESAARTMHNALRVYDGRPLLGAPREGGGHQWCTYGDARRRATRLAAALCARLPAGSTVGLCAANRPEWVVADFACAYARMVSVGLHTTWPRDELAYVMENSRMACVVCDAASLPRVLEAAAGQHRVPAVVLMDGGGGGQAGGRVTSMAALEEEGAALLARLGAAATHSGIGPDDEARPATVGFRDLPSCETPLPAASLPAPGARCLAPGCSHFATPDARYSLQSHRVRARGPPGYCNVCFNESPLETLTEAREAAAGEAAAAFPSASSPSSSSSLFTLVYSSGSTGRPKGCMIGGASWNASVAGPNTQRFVSPNVILSYSALGHALDRMLVWQTCTNGGRVGFCPPGCGWAGALECARTVRPVWMVAMPDFWTRVQAEFEAALERSLRRRAGPRDSAAALRALRRAALDETAALLGGRVQLCATGGAPISEACIEFVRECFGCHVIDAYGSTEASGISSNGALGSDVELRLEPAPAGGYTPDDVPYPRGEIVVRTGSMVSGYFGLPEATRETFGADGWVRTGDVGELEPGGHLRVIDRCKNLVELYVNGRSAWVAPERLQTLFAESHTVRQVFVHGERTAATLVAVVVPARDFCAEWTAAHWTRRVDVRAAPPPPPGELALLARCDALAEAVRSDLARVAAREGLAPHETPGAVLLDFDEWTPENGLLTCTHKLVRPAVLARFRDRIASALERAGRPSASSAAAAAVLAAVAAPLPAPPPALLRQRSWLPHLEPGSVLRWLVPAAERFAGGARADDARKVSFADLSEGCGEMAVAFYAHVRDTIEQSPDMLSIVPGFEFLVSSPLAAVAEALEVDQVTRFATAGWRAATVDDTVKRLDSDTFWELGEQAAAEEEHKDEEGAGAEAGAEAVLVTGASSRVGVEVVRRLLRRLPPSVFVWCLVGRDAGGSDEAAAELVSEALGRDWRAGRLVCVAGSASSPRLGLREAAYRMLRGTVAHVYHCSRDEEPRADLAAPYGVLGPGAAAGVRGVLRLLHGRPGARLLLLAGFASMWGVGVRRQSDAHPTEPGALLPLGEGHGTGSGARAAGVHLACGYAQASWVAERLARRAAPGLGVRLTVFRAGFLAFDSLARWESDLGCVPARLLAAALQMGCVPAERECFFSLTPTDYAADAMVAVALAGGPGDEDGADTYHLVAGSGRLTLRALAERLSGVATAAACPLAEWADRVLLLREASPAFAVWPALEAAARGGAAWPEFGVFGDDLTRARLRQLGVEPPHDESPGFCSWLTEVAALAEQRRFAMARVPQAAGAGKREGFVGEEEEEEEEEEDDDDEPTPEEVGLHGVTLMSRSERPRSRSSVGVMAAAAGVAAAAALVFVIRAVRSRGSGGGGGGGSSK